MHVRRYSPKTSNFFMFFEGGRPFIFFQPIGSIRGFTSRNVMTSKIEMTSRDQGIVLSGSWPIISRNQIETDAEPTANKQTSIPSKQHGTTHTKQQCSIDTLSSLSSRFWLCWFHWLTRVQILIQSCQLLTSGNIPELQGRSWNQKGRKCVAIDAIGNFNRLRSITFVDSRASQLYPIHLSWTQRIHRYSFLSSSYT